MLNKEIIMVNANVYQKMILNRMVLRIMLLFFNHVSSTSNSVYQFLFIPLVNFVA